MQRVRGRVHAVGQQAGDALKTEQSEVTGQPGPPTPAKPARAQGRLGHAEFSQSQMHPAAAQPGRLPGLFPGWPRWQLSIHQDTQDMLDWQGQEGRGSPTRKLPGEEAPEAPARPRHPDLPLTAPAERSGEGPVVREAESRATGERLMASETRTIWHQG